MQNTIISAFCLFMLSRFVAFVTSFNAFQLSIPSVARGNVRRSLARTMVSSSQWASEDQEQAKKARSLNVWPLDEYNAALLNEVHPLDYNEQVNVEPHEIYDLIAIGAGAGGLVSSKQSARRGAKSAMISEQLAGGDCLNVGCVPSKGLIGCAKAVSAMKRAAEFGIILGNSSDDCDSSSSDVAKFHVDFAAVMKRVRRLRATIAPADSHEGTSLTGAHVFQGRGRFTGPNSVEVNGISLQFKMCVVATGGRPAIPDIPGLADAPYTTNEKLFNLESLPPRMVILGAGVIALEMAQSFSLLGSEVTVINRSSRLFESKGGDKEAAELLQSKLEEDGVKFLSGSSVSEVKVLHRGDEETPSSFPLMKVTVGDAEYECECLLVATGRLANVEDLGLEAAGVEYRKGAGVVINDLAQSISNPSVYAVGDCVADVPRYTHMSGEMAKLVVQNGLAGDNWLVSSLVIPGVMYTEPEYATVGIASEDQATRKGIEVDVYRAGLEHNDRALLEGSNVGFTKIICKKGTDEILGASIVAERAGEMINEVSLAMKNGIGLYAIGRNVHAYPTTGEAIQGCGLQYINKNLPRFD